MKALRRAWPGILISQILLLSLLAVAILMFACDGCIWLGTAVLG